MRKKAEYVVTDDNRDEGKVFVIEEMPASQAERWAMKALMLAARSGISIPDAASGLGMQGVAMLGISALISASFEEMEPLLNDMMSCVRIKVTAPGKAAIVRELMEEDIEEVMTRFKLRQAVLELHVGFSMAGDASKSTSETAPAA